MVLKGLVPTAEQRTAAEVIAREQARRLDASAGTPWPMGDAGVEREQVPAPARIELVVQSLEVGSLPREGGPIVDEADRDLAALKVDLGHRLSASRAAPAASSA